MVFLKNKEIENAASFVLEQKYIHDIHSEIEERVWQISMVHHLKR